MSANVVGLKDISKAFKVSDETIYDYVQDGMPKLERGKYDLLECSLWLIEKLKEDLKKAKSSTEKSALDREKTRGAAIDAEIKELKAAQMRGELIPLSVYEKSVGAMFGFVRQGFLAFPGRVAAQVEGIDRHEIKNRLAAAVREILTGLSEEDALDKAIRDTRDTTAVDEYYRQRGVHKKLPAGKPGIIKKPRAASGGKHKSMGGRKPYIAKRGKQSAGAVAH